MANVIQRVSGQDNNGVNGDVTAVFGSNNTKGNKIIVVAMIANTTPAGFAAPTDTRGNTYVQIGSFTNGTSFTTQVWWETTNPIAAGANTVTCNPDTGACNLHAYEVSGLLPTQSFDKSSSTFGTVVTALTSGSTAATTVPNELLLGGFCVDGNDTYTVGGSFVNGVTEANTAFSSFTEEQIVGATGTYAATATASTGVVSLSVIMTFKAIVYPSQYQLKSLYQPQNVKPKIEIV